MNPWTVALQVPLSMGFSRQECWSGLPFPSPGDLPDPGIEPGSPTLQADSLPSELPPRPFCLENPIDRGARQATVHRITKSQTWLKWLSMHAGMHVCIEQRYICVVLFTYCLLPTSGKTLRGRKEGVNWIHKRNEKRLKTWVLSNTSVKSSASWDQEGAVSVLRVEVASVASDSWRPHGL